MSKYYEHYVEYLMPGNTRYTYEEHLDKREFKEALKKELRDCLGFRFFDREWNRDSKTYGPRTFESGWYYHGELMTIDEVENVGKGDELYRMLFTT